jgi:hypothetical protein
MSNVSTDRDGLVGGGQGRTAEENKSSAAMLALVILGALLFVVALAAGIV